MRYFLRGTAFRPCGKALRKPPLPPCRRRAGGGVLLGRLHPVLHHLAQFSPSGWGAEPVRSEPEFAGGGAGCFGQPCGLSCLLSPRPADGSAAGRHAGHPRPRRRKGQCLSPPVRRRAVLSGARSESVVFSGHPHCRSAVRHGIHPAGASADPAEKVPQIIRLLRPDRRRNLLGRVCSEPRTSRPCGCGAELPLCLLLPAAVFPGTFRTS